MKSEDKEIDETSENDLAVAPFILLIAGCRVINPAVSDQENKRSDGEIVFARFVYFFIFTSHSSLIRLQLP